jgi:hypothetical protein
VAKQRPIVTDNPIFEALTYAPPELGPVEEGGPDPGLVLELLLPEAGREAPIEASYGAKACPKKVSQRLRVSCNHRHGSWGQMKSDDDHPAQVSEEALSEIRWIGTKAAAAA